MSNSRAEKVFRSKLFIPIVIILGLFVITAPIAHFFLCQYIPDVIASGDVATASWLLRVDPLLRESRPLEPVLAERPLVIAIQNHHAGMVKLLIRRGANTHAKGWSRETPLHQAARYGTVEIVQILLAERVDMNSRDSVGETPLHWAAEGGNPDITTLLLSKGVDPRADDKYGQMPWHIAIIHGQRKAAEILRDHGAAGVYGVAEAASVGDLETIEREIARDPRLVNKPGIKGALPLHLAAWHGHNAVVRFLLAHGAEEDAEWDGETALNIAITADNMRAVKELVAKGAGVNRRGKYNAPLTEAIMDASMDTVMFLVLHGADVNDPKDMPLHVAIRRHREDVVEFLLVNGADVTAKDDGKTPLQLAEEWDEDAIAQVIRNHMKKWNAE